MCKEYASLHWLYDAMRANLERQQVRRHRLPSGLTQKWWIITFKVGKANYTLGEFISHGHHH